MEATLSEDTLILIYLLKILGPRGRLHLKEEMMARIETEPEAHKLLTAINRIERGLSQIARMTDEERESKGLPPRSPDHD